MTSLTSALITGAGSGIGRCFALALAAKVNTLVIVDVDPPGLHATAQLLANQPGDVLTEVVDVSNAHAVDELFTRLTPRLTSLDLLVNCAAILGGGEWLRQSREEFERVMQVDLIGTINMVRAALPSLQRARGQVVNLASTAALHGWPGLVAYSAAKFAVAGYSEAVRAELAAIGVNVMVVFPLLIDTPLLHRSGTPPILQVGKRIPAETVVTRVLDAVERRHTRVYIPRTVRLIAALHALAPSLLDWYGRRYGIDKARE